MLLVSILLWIIHLTNNYFNYNFDILGGGGVGKTFVIRLASQFCEKILRKAGDDPTKPKCLILAPTGVAASLIGNN